MGEWESYRLAGGLGVTGVGSNLDPRKSVRTLPTLVVLGHPTPPPLEAAGAEGPSSEPFRLWFS